MPYIDWMPFFNAWEFAGKFPDLLTDPVVGEAASSLYADARGMLDALVRREMARARGAVGFFPANASGDDIEVYADEARSAPLCRLHHLRQQKGEAATGQAQLCLADFIGAPCERARRLSRRIRRHRRHRHRGACGAIRGRA